MKTENNHKSNNTVKRKIFPLISATLSVIATLLCLRFLSSGILLYITGLAIIITFTLFTILFKDGKLTFLFSCIAVPFPFSLLFLDFSATYYKLKTVIKNKVYETLPDTHSSVETGFYKFEYLFSGEQTFKRLLYELEKASRRIYLEYYIIKDGKIWESVKNLLAKKSADGLDVRLITDGFGCIKMPTALQKWLKSHKIKHFSYNDLSTFFNFSILFRTHRKIAVVDEKVFIGGINLADEYVNDPSPFGYFKDTAVCFEGEISNLFAQCFKRFDGKNLSKENGTFKKNVLQTTDLSLPANKKRCKEHALPVTQYNAANNYNAKNTALSYRKKNCTYKDALSVIECRAYFNTPLYCNGFSSVILKSVTNAKKIYITSPYLSTSGKIFKALKEAAQRGTEIKIFIPSVPDKKIAYSVSLANAQKLSEYGIKIYEYTPGFLHSKLFYTDITACVGSANFDYRSEFFQREVGVFCSDVNFKKAVLNDFKQIAKHSKPVKFTNYLNPIKRITFFIYREILRFISPLF